MRNLNFPSLPVAVTYPDLSSLPYGNCRQVLNRESCRHMNFCLLSSMNFDLYYLVIALVILSESAYETALSPFFISKRLIRFVTPYSL